MKKIISVILVLTTMLTMMLSQGLTANADLMSATARLQQIQTTTGYIPGATAAVTGNCYGFIASVCEQLYGVSYNGEGLYNSYQCSHSTGNYYTVSTYTTASTYPSATDVEGIISFFTTYAYPGDIVHYGGLNSTGSHTIMIQSIDSQKMEFYHSNYETKTYSRESCHIDTIYWDSFRGNPAQSVDTTSGYSMNALFYQKMKTSGLGITINRYKNYESLYVPVSGAVPVVTTTRSSPTSIKLSWGSVSNALQYRIQYKLTGSADFTTITDACTDTSYDVLGLTLGCSYDFRVCAYANYVWNDYSPVVTLTALPPTISKVTFSNEVNGIKMSWAKRTDLDGVRIFRSTSKNGNYELVADLTESGVSSYLDTNVVGNTKYFYKFSRYIIRNGIEYSTLSAAKSVDCTMTVLSAPSDITAKSNSISSIIVSWDSVPSATYYIVEYKSASGDWKLYSTTSACSMKVSSLKAGAKYSFRVKASNGIIEGPYSNTVTKKATVKTPSKPTATVTSKGIKLKWSKVPSASGYKVYRAYSKNGSYKLVKTISRASTRYYVDTKVTKNKGYYYKIVAYQKVSKKTYVSDKSSARYKKFAK